MWGIAPRSKQTLGRPTKNQSMSACVVVVFDQADT